MESRGVAPRWCRMLPSATPINRASQQGTTAVRSDTTNHVVTLPDTRQHSVHGRKGRHLRRTLIRENHALKLKVVLLTSADVVHKIIGAMCPRDRVREELRQISPYLMYIFFRWSNPLRCIGDCARRWKVRKNLHRTYFPDAQKQIGRSWCRVWVPRNPVPGVNNNRVHRGWILILLIGNRTISRRKDIIRPAVLVVVGQ